MSASPGEAFAAGGGGTMPLAAILAGSAAEDHGVRDLAALVADALVGTGDDHRGAAVAARSSDIGDGKSIGAFSGRVGPTSVECGGRRDYPDSEPVGRMNRCERPQRRSSVGRRTISMKSAPLSSGSARPAATASAAAGSS
jgi:hypothetical protein